MEKEGRGRGGKVWGRVGRGRRGMKGLWTLTVQETD